ncbi:MAG: class IV adenylate cyclase [bacterium]|nr:class IV adenylate cyclase [bacterium]
MPRNVEAKARVADLEAARAIALRLGARDTGVDAQVDRYYALDGGRRVKLRTSRDGAYLIHYDRAETAGVRSSDYTRTPVRDDEAGRCLVPKTDPLVTVRKRRRILLLDNVRIHLDDVEGLGTFLELEAVVDADHDDVRCRAQVAELLAAFGLGDADLIRASYGELVGNPS